MEDNKERIVIMVVILVVLVVKSSGDEAKGYFPVGKMSKNGSRGEFSDIFSGNKFLDPRKIFQGGHPIVICGRTSYSYTVCLPDPNNVLKTEKCFANVKGKIYRTLNRNCGKPG